MPGLNEAFDRTWSRAAAAVCRKFARRLYGFDRSTPRYLSDRFLQTDCVVTQADRCIEAVLERCELDIVLRMAGFDEEWSCRLPWLDRPLVQEFAWQARKH